jgi:hypothetical protein
MEFQIATELQSSSWQIAVCCDICGISQLSLLLGVGFYRSYIDAPVWRWCRPLLSDEARDAVGPEVEALDPANGRHRVRASCRVLTKLLRRIRQILPISDDSFTVTQTGRAIIAETFMMSDQPTLKLSPSRLVGPRSVRTTEWPKNAPQATRFTSNYTAESGILTAGAMMADQVDGRGSCCYCRTWLRHRRRLRLRRPKPGLIAASVDDVRLIHCDPAVGAISVCRRELRFTTADDGNATQYCGQRD